jgi:hypothetical protein
MPACVGPAPTPAVCGGGPCGHAEAASKALSAVKPLTSVLADVVGLAADFAFVPETPVSAEPVALEGVVGPTALFAAVPEPSVHAEPGQSLAHCEYFVGVANRQLSLCSKRIAQRRDNEGGLGRRVSVADQELC